MVASLSQKCRIQNLSNAYGFNTVVDVLRLDELHPVVSGNKWFKLKGYLQEAKQQNKQTLLTYGGAYSNHIVATAAAAEAAGLQSIGVIRGERPPALSHTLVAAQSYGMRLIFVSREAYRRKTVPTEVYTIANAETLYVIPEGGYGPLGRDGASSILTEYDIKGYTHILAAVGTGTTVAGLATAALDHQKVLGIAVLKNALSLQEEIGNLLPPDRHERFALLHEFHFGGYARYTNDLLWFMNDLYQRTGVPTDFVYTGKAAFAAVTLMRAGFFRGSDRVLLVHTGGLQGNRSLPKGRLIFE